MNVPYPLDVVENGLWDIVLTFVKTLARVVVRRSGRRRDWRRISRRRLRVLEMFEIIQPDAMDVVGMGVWRS